MSKKIIKRVVLGILSFIALMFIVLAVHIYMVTRPKAPDAHTLIMARIDIKKDIDSTDAQKITQWMYTQKGIDHVLCNPQTNIVIFTYHPILNTADHIISGFQKEMKYPADRYMPSAEELQKGCPVASNSFSYKMATYLKKIF